jgi:predicted nucleotidyltransferase
VARNKKKNFTRRRGGKKRGGHGGFIRFGLCVDLCVRGEKQEEGFHAEARREETRRRGGRSLRSWRETRRSISRGGAERRNAEGAERRNAEGAEGGRGEKQFNFEENSFYKMVNAHQIDLINSALLKYSPEKIGLFGSRMRGDEHANSDLDILVSFKNNGKSPYSLFELLSVEKSLEDKLGFKVEIVNENNIKNSMLRQSIFSDLMIIYQNG